VGFSDIATGMETVLIQAQQIAVASNRLLQKLEDFDRTSVACLPGWVNCAFY